ncbi:MAG: tetratricopeptide repeat protein [Chitinophagales bacterium]|nr:tetratricopeptide repeat protein [Chitinophagales bacterium]
MEERDFDEMSPVDIISSVERYEEMVNSGASSFFDVSTFEHIIQYYELKEQWKKALHVLDYAIGQHPFSTSLLIKKAGLLIYYRKFKESFALLEQAEALEPSDIAIFILRSDLYVEKGMHKEALEVLDHAIKIADKGDHEELYLEVADVYEDCDRYDMVFECLKKVLGMNSSNEEALSRMWYVVELSKKFDESIELHKGILDNDPYSYLAWHNLGHAYFDLGMYEKAVEAYEFVTAINESCDLAYRDCGEAYFQLKQYHKAIDQFQLAIEFSKPYEELFFSIGVCLEKLKDYNKARTFYRKAITIDPKYDEAYFRIGETYKREKLWSNALNFYKKALRLMPDNVQYLMGMAVGFYKREDVSALIFACQSIMALNPRHKPKGIYEKLITYLIDLECYLDAIKLLDFAAIEKGEMPSFPFLRSASLFKIGLKKEAIAWLEEGLSNNYAKHKVMFKLAPELKNDPIITSIIEQFK